MRPVGSAGMGSRFHGRGPLEPRIPELLQTPSGRIELCPPPIVAEVRRLAEAPPVREDQFVVVGRRHLRSNNSWMHNVAGLVKGRPLCTVVVNSSDAKRIGLVAGGRAVVTSRVGSVELPVEVTDDLCLDPLSGTAVLNGVPVEVRPV